MVRKRDACSLLFASMTVRKSGRRSERSGTQPFVDVLVAVKMELQLGR